MALQQGFQTILRVRSGIRPTQFMFNSFQLPMPPYKPQIRGIKYDVRPKILYLRKRKLKNEQLNPGLKDKPQIRSTFIEWNYDAELYAFGKRLNEIFDGQALRLALTHRSYAVQEEKRLEELGLDPKKMDLRDNEFMSADGMAILKSTLEPLLKHEFDKFPEEGVQALINYLTSQPVLADISSRIGTKDIILCSDPPPSEEILAKTFLAILTAISKSGCGQPRTKSFIEDFVLTYLCGKNVNEIWNIPSPFKMLSSIMKDQFDQSIEPRIITESGKNTILAAFIVGIYTSDKRLLGTGGGETVDIAQEMGARDALSRLFGTREPRPSLKFLEDRILSAANI